MYVAIISMAQQARPKVIGQSDDFLDAAITRSAGTWITPGSTLLYSARPGWYSTGARRSTSLGCSLGSGGAGTAGTGIGAGGASGACGVVSVTFTAT
jgi:hypothetical protein